jgi:hypothetical protein
MASPQCPAPTTTVVVHRVAGLDGEDVPCRDAAVDTRATIMRARSRLLTDGYAGCRTLAISRAAAAGSATGTNASAATSVRPAADRLSSVRLVPQRQLLIDLAALRTRSPMRPVVQADGVSTLRSRLRGWQEDP